MHLRILLAFSIQDLLLHPIHQSHCIYTSAQTTFCSIYSESELVESCSKNHWDSMGFLWFYLHPCSSQQKTLPVVLLKANQSLSYDGSKIAPTNFLRFLCSLDVSAATLTQTRRAWQELTGLNIPADWQTGRNETNYCPDDAQWERKWKKHVHRAQVARKNSGVSGLCCSLLSRWEVLAAGTFHLRQQYGAMALIQEDWKGTDYAVQSILA